MGKGRSVMRFRSNFGMGVRSYLGNGMVEKGLVRLSNLCNVKLYLLIFRGLNSFNINYFQSNFLLVQLLFEICLQISGIYSPGKMRVLIIYYLTI